MHMRSILSPSRAAFFDYVGGAFVLPAVAPVRTGVMQEGADGLAAPPG
jgi:hypothetical protein